MRLTPRSTARRSTRTASSGSRGSPHTPAPVSCIEPNPRRLTLSSPPMVKVPAAPALGIGVVSVMSVLASRVASLQRCAGLRIQCAVDDEQTGSCDRDDLVATVADLGGGVGHSLAGLDDPANRAQHAGAVSNRAQ